MQPLLNFLHTEVAGGVVLLVAAIAALVWANSPARGSYEALWHTEFALRLGPLVIAEDLAHWVNDLLMALFFFVVGLEIKREIVHGELRDPRAAAVPVLAALGGMVVPALLYVALSGGMPAARGWGIPMATDIAFALGVLALVGRRAPLSLKVFLLTLAVADDLGAIAVIAVFYSEGVILGWLAVAAATVAVILVLQRLGVRALPPYAVAAVVLWLATYSSGVHATIAGVLLGLLTPSRSFHEPEVVAGTVREQLLAVAGEQDVPAGGSDDERDEQVLIEVRRLAHEAVSPLARLQASLHPWTAYGVLPVFALANAGVAVDRDAVAAAFDGSVTWAVAAGLVVGKPLGVTLGCLFAVKVLRLRLPSQVGWPEVIGAGLLAGIGFTVALFVAGLSFRDPALTEAAKVGVLVASLFAGALGAAFLAWRDAGAGAGPEPYPNVVEPVKEKAGNRSAGNGAPPPNSSVP